MRFIHEDPEFDALLNIVAADLGLSVGLVEKDYWVTHVFWVLQQTGFEIWFKGGTSLSKGFGLIKRFSEDLDLRIDPGAAAEFSVPENWRSEGTTATSARREYFQRLAALIVIPGTETSLEDDPTLDHWRGIKIRVKYPGRYLAALEPMKPFVLLEIGNARVTPFVERDLTSFIHEYLSGLGRLGDYIDNRPRAIRCLHPLVTLVEKLEAIQRRFDRGDEPAAFIRHYEDAAVIIADESSLPYLEGYASNRELVEDMLKQGDIRRLLSESEAAYSPDDGERWTELRAAHAAIADMYWGPRIELDEVCQGIRTWIGRLRRSR